MKKITSLLLALVMALALAVPAFAAGEEIDPAAGSEGKTKDVTAKYTAPEDRDGGTVYYFTIKWAQNEEKNLAYVGADTTYTWDGANMKYVPTPTNPGQVVGWQGSNGYNVTVTNQSNEKVSVTTSAPANFGLTATPSGAIGGDLEPATKTEDGVNITYKDTNLKGKETTFDVTYTYDNTNNTGTAPNVDKTLTSVTVGTITVKVTK